MGATPKWHDEKVRRGYRNKDTVVWADGRERLEGYDWTKRKRELAKRSGGRCENILLDARKNAFRCFQQARDPHHMIKRSVCRDDRIENLLHVCGDCHTALDPRQVRWTKRG